MVAVALFAGAAVFAADLQAAPSIPKGALRVDVSGIPASRPIPPGFIGFSIEYWSLLPYAGREPAALNPTFVTLVRALTPSASPVIRFGGDTTDWTWWPTPGVAKPPGIKYALTRRWLAVARASALAMGARLILGINFEADSRAIARSEADALLRGLGRRLIAGFELGNEPEVYGTIGWYTNRRGIGIDGRPGNYGFRSYLRDYAAIASALPRGVPLVGPASSAEPWLGGLGRYLHRNPRVRIVSFHRYPLHRCYTVPGSPTYPTIANLLVLDASLGPAQSLSDAVAVAHADGLTVRVDELNSVSCGGAWGVSNTFASALWVLDTLFRMAGVGVDGVNIHTFWTARYAPFWFSHTQAGWEASVAPIYYGLLLFSRAAPAGSRLLAAYAPPTPGDALRIWATRGRAGIVRIVLIDDSRSRPYTVAILPPRAGATGALERLLAPRPSATSGVTLAGQRFEPSTMTAQLTGTPVVATVQPIQRHYVVTVPPGSAALLTLG